MLKRSIVLGLCCVSAQLYSAPIYVTTTEDSVAADQQCSLREAIEYINQGMPKAGYNGCGGEGAENTIYLKARTTYSLNRQVKIQKNLIIRTQFSADADQVRPALDNAVIKMQGSDRLFWIERAEKAVSRDEESSPPAPIAVSFLQLSLKGCEQSRCQDQGGLIYNKENIEIRLSQLLNGKARQGGAIYNAGSYVKDQPLSTVIMFDSQFKDNQAEQGAVIYSQLPQFIAARLVVRDNQVSRHDATLFDIETPFNEEQLKALGSDLRRGISNSTFLNNRGYLFKVVDGMIVNNSTMVMNDKGVIFDGPLKQAYLVNSILLNNGQQDCQVLRGGDADHLSNNLYQSGCAGSAGQQLPADSVILAGKTIDGACDLSSQGILCPLNSQSNDSPWGFLKPRLLSSYQKMSDSPIVNRGPQAGSNLLSCASEDQRGKPRPVSSPADCDRGAIELYQQGKGVAKVGADIRYGQIAKMTLDEQLQDGELVTPTVCDSLLGPRPDGQAWQPGCLRTVQSNETPTSKGRVTLSQDGILTYVPNGDWHGKDDFITLVITSTTRFSDAKNRDVQIKTSIVQDPPDTFENKKVGGGATDVWGVLALALLLLVRYGWRQFGGKQDAV